MRVANDDVKNPPFKAKVEILAQEFHYRTSILDAFFQESKGDFQIIMLRYYISKRLTFQGLKFVFLFSDFDIRHSAQPKN